MVCACESSSRRCLRHMITASARPTTPGHKVRGLSVVNAETAVLGMRGYARELRLAHVQQRLVIAGFQIDLRLLLHAVVHNDVQSVALADRGNRTTGTVTKQL